VVCGDFLYFGGQCRNVGGGRVKEFHTKPDVSDTKEASSLVDDHLGKTHVMLTTWGNGEGFSIELQDIDGKTNQKQRLEMTWSQWRAIRACLKKVQK
jgi:hypothetical protein